MLTDTTAGTLSISGTDGSTATTTDAPTSTDSPTVTTDAPTTTNPVTKSTDSTTTESPTTAVDPTTTTEPTTTDHAPTPTTTTSTSTTDTTDTTDTDTTTGDPLVGKSITQTVNSGTVASSPNFRMVFTLGQPHPEPGRLHLEQLSPAGRPHRRQREPSMTIARDCILDEEMVARCRSSRPRGSLPPRRPARSRCPSSSPTRAACSTPTASPVDGTQDLTFTIYDAEVAGNEIWSETITVDFDEGFFSVRLGEQLVLDENVFDGSTRWLGITVGADPEMTPRAAIVSVPYAMFAGDVRGEINPTNVNIQGFGRVIDQNGQWVGDPSA